MPPSVLISEVGPRDGLQSVSRTMALAEGTPNYMPANPKFLGMRPVVDDTGR